eukprot:1161241-Pelagomonas_calceolata.AAC.6
MRCRQLCGGLERLAASGTYTYQPIVDDGVQLLIVMLDCRQLCGGLERLAATGTYTYQPIVDDGNFVVALNGLQPGTYYYKFIVDGVWAIDPLAPKEAGGMCNLLVWHMCCGRLPSAQAMSVCGQVSILKEGFRGQKDDDIGVNQRIQGWRHWTVHIRLFKIRS